MKIPKLLGGWSQSGLYHKIIIKMSYIVIYKQLKVNDVAKKWFNQTKMLGLIIGKGSKFWLKKKKEY